MSYSTPLVIEITVLLLSKCCIGSRNLPNLAREDPPNSHYPRSILYQNEFASSTGISRAQSINFSSGNRRNRSYFIKFMPSHLVVYKGECFLIISNFPGGWVGSAKSRLIDISMITLPDYIWIAESPNPNVLWHFHQKIVITCITYTIATHYYMHYLSKKPKTRKRRAKRWKLKVKT